MPEGVSMTSVAAEGAFDPSVCLMGLDATFVSGVYDAFPRDLCPSLAASRRTSI